MVFQTFQSCLKCATVKTAKPKLLYFVCRRLVR